MTGPCAKRQVKCEIISLDGNIFHGENDCLNPQPVCPRNSGEGYEKCESICRQTGHAEENALRKANENAKGAIAIIYGHYYICAPCGDHLRKAGIKEIIMRDIK